jgi:hypothetical protein
MNKNNVKATTIKKFKNEKKLKMEEEQLEDSVENKIRNKKEMHFVDHNIDDDDEPEDENLVSLLI